MRNIFDQYSQPESRVTHALMTAIHKDQALLGSFLRDLVKIKPPASLQTLWGGRPKRVKTHGSVLHAML